jgi:hypothetical protein
MKTFYFHISHGLRGCYMPDGEPYVVAASTRRALKAMVANEANMLQTGETIGLNAKAIASFVAQCWRTRKGGAHLPYCLPCKERGQSSYSYGIFVSNAARSEYLAQAEMEV